MIDISKAFDTRSETVFDFFQRTQIGYYIPLYQREYSWDIENIEQLMEDICNGVSALPSEEESGRNIHFLGTIILVRENHPRQNIEPVDYRALPDPIMNIIDGQQRVSTMALLACCLYKKIYDLNKKIATRNELESLKTEKVLDNYLENLESIFSLELKRGIPPNKPRIIRGSVDQWTLDGEDSNYKSDVSSFLSEFIRNIYNGNNETENVTNLNLPRGRKDSRVRKNINKINTWLKKVEEAHIKSNEDFLPASEVLKVIGEQNLWAYERTEIVELITSNADNANKKSKDLSCRLVQLLGFTHYFLRRCCFTTIIPESEDWAFDMFQSLNATGTPLTALETFKPQVVSSIGGDRDFKKSNSAKYFEHIDTLLRLERTASKKSKLTNDFLTLFGTSLNGNKKPERQFSRQRRWLSEEYLKCSSNKKKEEFVRRMGDTAQYWKHAVGLDSSNRQEAIDGLKEVNENLREEAALCIQYLKDANHRMAHAIINRYYSKALRSKDVIVATEFSKVCKKIASFFTLWRATLPNTGLDDVYRNLLKTKLSWECGDSHLDLATVSEYFLDELSKKGVGSQQAWLSRAKDFLRYDKRTICKFALLISAHETIPDRDLSGLMKIGKARATPNILKVSSWKSEDFKTIEHVAPQKNQPDVSSWDKTLYTETDDFHKVGNLILFPVNLNSSTSNKGWSEKYLYFQHLANKQSAESVELQEIATRENIVLSEDTLALLMDTTYKFHVEPIVRLGFDGQWDKEFVDARSERICEILWARMMEWLEEH